MPRKTTEIKPVEVDAGMIAAAQTLNARQLIAIPHLAAGVTCRECAELTDIPFDTIRGWFRNEEFVAELNRVKAEKYASAVAAAIDEIEGQFRDKKASKLVKFRAANALLKYDGIVQLRSSRKTVRFEGLEKIREVLHQEINDTVEVEFEEIND